MLSLRAKSGRSLRLLGIIFAAFISHYEHESSIGGEPRFTSVKDATSAKHVVEPTLLRVPSIEPEWKAVSLSSDGDMVVWHDNRTGRLLFHDLGRSEQGDFQLPSFTMEQSRYEHLKFCLVPNSPSRCVLVLSDARGLEVVILRYPGMTVDECITIPFPQDSDLLSYSTSAAIGPSGQRIAVASNHEVWILDKLRNDWLVRKGWWTNARGFSSLGWSPNEELLAFGWHRDLFVARVSDQKIDILPIKAVPNLSPTVLREHAERGTLGQAYEGTLYEVGLRLWGIYSVRFFEHGELLLACGACLKATTGKNIRPTHASGFVALWDASTMQLVSCDFFPDTPTLEIHPSWARRSYFASLYGRDKRIRIQEMDIDSGSIRCTYRVLPGSDSTDRLSQFAVSEKRSELIGIHRDGRVVTWSLSDEKGKAKGLKK